MLTRLLTALGLALACSACLSFGPDPEAPSMRFFTPHPGPWPEDVPARRWQTSKVDAVEHLGEELAWRRDGVELGFYGLARWSELPVDALRRLIELQPVADAQGAGLPYIYVRLEAFEEDISSGSREALVRLFARPVKGTGAPAWAEVRKPVAEDGPLALVRALHAALPEAVLQLVDYTGQ